MKKTLVRFLIAILIFPCLYTFYEPPLSEKESDEIAGLYIEILDDLFNNEFMPKSSIHKVAVSTGYMKNVTNKGRKKILNHFGHYDYKILDMTMDELDKNGYIVRDCFSSGAQLGIYDEKISNGKFVYSARNWQDGMCAVVEVDGIIEKKAGHWVISKRGAVGIS